MWSGQKVLVKRKEKAIGLLSYIKHPWLEHIMLMCFLSQQKQPVKKNPKPLLNRVEVTGKVGLSGRRTG